MPSTNRRACGLSPASTSSLVRTAGCVLWLPQRVASYRRELAEAGKGNADRLPIAVNRVVHVVSSRAEKRRAEEFFSRTFLSFYDQWGHADVVALGADQRVHERTSRKHFILGEPAECVELVREYAELGIGHIACLMNFGKPEPEVAEQSLRLFGEHVLPACAAL